MKGLMVSLIIVIFADMTSTVVAAGQQAEQDAAKFKPGLGLQPIAAPRFDRPGPDDSDDDVAWPTPTSLLSRGSTNTSSIGNRQLRAPAPEGVMDKNIRFDVKVDANAIDLLKQGRKVFSPVEVRDQTTHALLNPVVVSDIALFLGANAGKDLQGVQLDPQPMEPGSNTLLFEIQEQQLLQIEKNAFLFNVPDELRGKFNRVEFVAVRPSSGVSSGPRGSGLSFGDSNANTVPRWKTTESPQPGPGFDPGEFGFTGPHISTAELQRRDRVASLGSNRPTAEFTDSRLNTGNRFGFANRQPPVEPKQSPYSLPRQQPERNQSTGQNTFPQNTISQPSNDQGYQESFAERQLRVVKQQLAQAKADQKLLLQDASDWKREAGIMAQQRNELGEQLQAVNESVNTKQPVSTPPVRYAAVGRDYMGRLIDAAGNLVTPFGSQREHFQSRETAFTGRTQAESDRQKMIDMQSQIEYQKKELANAKELLERRSTYDSGYQPTSYVGRNSDGSLRFADADLAYGQGDPGAKKLAHDLAEKQNAGVTPLGGLGDRDPTDGPDQELTANRKSSSDLIWLLPLLFCSLGLNFFLWIHSRTLYLRYEELADELRGMVGGSTI